MRDRGYAGKYYEPIIVADDLLTDTTTYMTKLGGGATPAGESVYERRQPSLSNGRIIYQQGELTVRYIISNDGEGQAWNITPRRVITNPETVTVCGGRPAPGSSIRVGR